MNKEKFAGFSLIEFLIVLAVSVSLISLVYIVFKKVKVSEDAQVIVSNINVVSEKYKELYADRVVSYADRVVSYDETVTGNDDNSGIFDYVTEGLYTKKNYSLAGSSSEVYINKTSLISLNNSGNLFNINLIVDKNLCVKVLTQLLATGNYIITPDTMSGSSKTYANSDTKGLAALPNNTEYITNYNQTMLISDCTQSIQPDLAAVLGDSFTNATSMNIIVVP